MNPIEKLCIAIRHSPSLKNSGWLWNCIRPAYDVLVGLFGCRGLERVVNGTDRILIHPKYRNFPETYEFEVWSHMADQVREGDRIVDVGAFIGIYSIPFGNRVGKNGGVIYFEPDPANFKALEPRIHINHMEDRVKAVNAAVSEKSGETLFEALNNSESRLCIHPASSGTKVRSIRLVNYFAGEKIDIIKIDGEGFEEAVLRSEKELLNDLERCPRLIYFEVHPWAWQAQGRSDASLLDLLWECDYTVQGLCGERFNKIETYGEIIAYKNYGAQAE